MQRRLLSWGFWLLLVGTMSAYFTFRIRSEDRTIFLPGQTTRGHYQIEMKCDVCHTALMGVKEEACLSCHGAELKSANDSHPKSKFTDPRNATRLRKLDASHCLTCHREHVPAQTRPLGVTLPDDFCFHCHEEIGRERPSHRDFTFQSCNTAGCHNYHDNTALYEDFLRKQFDAPIPEGHVLVRTALKISAASLQAKDADVPSEVTINDGIALAWSASAHARAGIECGGCHLTEAAEATGTGRWHNEVDHLTCGRCHASEVEGFLRSRHGMRLAQGLKAMEPRWARQPMKSESAHRKLTCAACHPAHAFETQSAARDACLSCHNDDHSLNYEGSPHARAWRSELGGQSDPGTGVNCATCHFPRYRSEAGEVLVQHNQNDNLRPNEKMLRSVCLNCHDLAFSLDALADANLVRSNFRGRPEIHVQSMDLVQQRHLNNSKTKP